MQRSVLLALLALWLILAVVPVNAQDNQNLLRDGSFEAQYTGRGRGDFNIPQDWTATIISGRPTAFPHNGPDPDPQQGRQALNMEQPWSIYTVAVFQQVSVPEGSNVRGSVYGYLHTCRVPKDNQKCSSVPDFGAYIKVGIDPNGGTDINDGDIVWSGQASPHDNWQQLSVDSTATGGTVTFFIYTTQTQTPSADEDRWEADLNKVYFDNASLVIGGGGGSAGGGGGGRNNNNNPPPPAFAPAVNAQDAQEDGSIVHTVQAGDTIDAIAVAYGVTRADILALNNISDPRIIQIGQELKIREGESDSGNRNNRNNADNADEGSSDQNADDSNGDSAPEDNGGDNADEGSSAGDSGDEGEDSDSPSISPEDAPPAPVLSVASGNVLPARDPGSLTASVCVLLFDDANQNRIQEEGEALLQGGRVSIRSNGTEINSYTTDGASEPYCVTDLTAGDYVAVGSAPQGFGLTTPNQLRVRANPGARVDVMFGAAEGVVPAMVPPPDDLVIADDRPADEPQAPRNPIRDNLGLFVFGLAGAVLVAGAGTSLLMRRR